MKINPTKRSKIQQFKTRPILMDNNKIDDIEG